MGLTVAMPNAGVHEQVQLMVLEIEQASESFGKQRSAHSVLRIVAVRSTTGVMQKCEALDHSRICSSPCGQFRANESNPSPVRSSMYSVPVEHEALADRSEDGFCDHAA